MLQLSEGLRVVTARELRYLCVEPHNRAVVTFNRCTYEADRVLPGTVGTIFRFRIRKGLPTSGLAHAEMWGVAWDGVPPTVGDNYGLADAEGLDAAPDQQGDALAGLREAWEAALAGRRAIEARLARLHRALPPGRYAIGPTDLWDQFKAAAQDADEARKAYDAAASLPAREV